jgi:hypothetical protein
MADPPAKLKITNETTNTSIECQFNPKEFKLGKRVQWTPVDTQNEDVSKMNFGGGKPQTYTLNLLFDTTDTGTDVRTQYTNFLLKLLQIDTTKKDANGKPTHEPPNCRLSWGSLLSIPCVVEEVDLTFTFFLSDGTPVRANAAVTFKQKVDENQQQAQNPTTRTQARKTRIVHEGERLDWIAYQEYGSVAHWRHIAETNNLADPGALRAGQILKLVPLP